MTDSKDRSGDQQECPDVEALRSALSYLRAEALRLGRADVVEAIDHALGLL